MDEYKDREEAAFPSCKQSCKLSANFGRLLVDLSPRCIPKEGKI